MIRNRQHLVGPNHHRSVQRFCVDMVCCALLLPVGFRFFFRTTTKHSKQPKKQTNTAILTGRMHDRSMAMRQTPHFERTRSHQPTPVPTLHRRTDSGHSRVCFRCSDFRVFGSNRRLLYIPLYSISHWRCQCCARTVIQAQYSKGGMALSRP